MDVQPAPAPALSTRAAAADDTPARRWGWLLRWAGTGLGVAYLIAVVNVDTLSGALAKTSIGTVLVALAADELVRLPFFADLDDADQGRVIDAVRSFR